jgi:hypothetical protein
MAVLEEWSPPRFAGEQKPAYRPPDSKIADLDALLALDSVSRQQRQS